ncbi:hypothetical protein [Actinoallomurus sp. CA-150999]
MASGERFRRSAVISLPKHTKNEHNKKPKKMTRTIDGFRLAKHC